MMLIKIPTLQAVNFFLRWTARDLVCVLLLLLVSISLRIPSLATPAVSEFDEVIYANYTLHLLDHIPFMDIHPPLVRIIFAEIARLSLPFETKWIPITFGQPFGDFPYVALRTFIAVFGSLLPLLVYTIGRLLNYRPRTSLLIGLFIATDNALIIYSRVLLPDTLLLCFNFLALLLALASVRAQSKKTRYLYAGSAALAIGLALSIKWTALATLAVLILLYTCYRHKIIPILTILVALTVYVAIFVFGLSHYFPEGGRTDNFKSDRAHPWLATIVFPNMEHPIRALHYLPELHKYMLNANSDPYVVNGALQSLGPQSWAIAKSAMIFWPMKSADQQIVLTGNTVLWVTSFFVFLFEFCWISLRFIRARTISIEKDELILLAGYIMNYLPFFFIHRPMYTYHYFTAFVFLILLLPKVTPRIVECLGKVVNDQLFAKVFVATIVFLFFVNVVLLLPITYGW